MRANLGSLSQWKLRAVMETINEYPYLGIKKVEPCDVSSDVSEHPFSLADVLRGAEQRARYAFINNAQLSIGIQNGFVHIPSGNVLLSTCACAVYEGDEKIYFGTSPGFMFPRATGRSLLAGSSVADALARGGLQADTFVDAISIVSLGRFSYVSYASCAVGIALNSIERFRAHQKV